MASESRHDRLSGSATALSALARFQPGGWWMRVAIGLGFAAAVLLLRWGLSFAYGSITGFMILLPGVILAAVAAGRIAGLTALITALLGGWAVVSAASGSGSSVVAGLWEVATINFVVVGLFCIWVSATLRDVVLRLSRTDAALDEEERRFRDIADVAPVMLWSADASGRVYVNAEFRRFWGDRPMSGGDMKAWIAAIHPEDRDRVVQMSTRAMSRREPMDLEARYLRHDGQWRTLRTFCRPRSGPDSGFLGMVGANVDVTESRAAELRLRESEERFRLMADTAPSPVWMTNADAEVEFVNQALVDFYGRPRENLVGHVWKAAIHPDDGPVVAAAMERARPERLPYGFEVRFERADGVWRWMRVSVSPRLDPDGSFLGYVGMSFDVTDTREALDALRESEQRFRAVADTAPVLIWVTDADRTRAFVNEAYVAFHGGAYEEARLADWRQAIHPDDQDRIVAESIAGEATGKPFALEARYRRQDGAWRWLKSFSRPRLGSDGEVIGFVGVAFDVTDTREGAERLANIAAERDAILGQLAEGVIVTDPHGAIIFVNEAAVRHHGVDSLDVPLEAYSSTYHLFTEAGEPYPVEDLPLARAVMKGETVLEARWRIRRPDGREVLAVGNARPVFAADGSRIGAVLTLRDETARIAAENRLAESESRFRTLADSAPALIYMIDEAGKVTFANRRYRTFFDVDAEDMLGDGWRRIVHEDDVDAFHDAFNDAFAKRESFERQVRVRHPSLGVRWLRCEAIPRIDAGGVFQGYVGANLDVTEAKQAEVDLKRINELLEERVGAALAEKAKAEADLMHAQRMEAVGRLTGGVAHDFNNLLTVVIGALDMMLRAPDDAKRQARLGEAALAAARRGERLTHQLLAFSRRQTLRPEPTDLNALILEGEPLLRRAVGEAVQLELKLADRPVWVNVDPAQFEAALLNLVVNARDAVAEGGHVVVETRVRRLRAGQLADLGAGDHVCVSVSDDGKGIDPDVLPRIFEPFFTTKPIGKGTGLGLSQVYGFSHQSGGGLDVESEPGRGTTIRMFLPAIRGGGASTSDARDVPTTAARSGRRLLLVEDDVAVAAVAAEMIESLGFDVRVAEHAAAALDVLKTETFDVMLTDVVMPGGMSGVDLARQTAADWPAMSIVLASGYAAEEMDRVVADAPWPFVRKPYSRETLAEVLTAEPV